MGNMLSLFFFYFQKVFDSFPHGPLITKLQNTGLHPHIIVKWVQSYLTNRTQRVVVNGSESVSVNVVSGVPQGSVLVLCCFLVYVNDLCDIALSRGSKLVMYADNLVLYKVIDVEAAFLLLQEDINKHNGNHMNNQNAKSCFCLENAIICHQCLLNMIKLCKFQQYNGLIITPSLKWDEHIEQLCLRAKRLLGYLYRILHRNVQPFFLYNLFTSLVRLVLDYACQVWEQKLKICST